MSTPAVSAVIRKQKVGGEEVAHAMHMCCRMSWGLFGRLLIVSHLQMLEIAVRSAHYC